MKKIISIVVVLTLLLIAACAPQVAPSADTMTDDMVADKDAAPDVTVPGDADVAEIDDLDSEIDTSELDDIDTELDDLTW
jgi:peptidoglycan hydrolase CwlO-like protein